MMRFDYRRLLQVSLSTMGLPQYIPLTTGIILPLATFINVQSITVPGWTWIHSPIGYHRSGLVSACTILSLAFGTLATISLFVRMLEKKIKWTTRLFITGSTGQGIFNLITLLLFPILHQQVPGSNYTEGVTYCLLSAVLSLISGGLAAYLHHLNRNQTYSYTLYELSSVQRQLILLTIGWFLYLVSTSLLYAYLENWHFDDALYWAVVTYSTIGFGDFHPTNSVSMALFPVIALFGVALLGTQAWSIHNVILEQLTLGLAGHYSREFGDGTAPNMQPHVVVRRMSDSALYCQHLPGHPSSVSSPASSNIAMDHDMPDLHLGIPMPPESNRRKLTVSRSQQLPKVTIIGQGLQETHVINLTRDILRYHIIFGASILCITIFSAACIFAELESWTIFEGLYFSYNSIVSIGYGDYVLKTRMGRSIFIWYVFFSICFSTYLASMIAEIALDEWSVTVGTIEKRVDRYETKATLKRYGKSTLSLKAKTKPEIPSETRPLLIENRPGDNSSDSESEQPRAFSVSVTNRSFPPRN